MNLQAEFILHHFSVPKPARLGGSRLLAALVAFLFAEVTVGQTPGVDAGTNLLDGRFRWKVGQPVLSVEQGKLPASARTSLDLRERPECCAI